jgi:hypothetical protein
VDGRDKPGHDEDCDNRAGVLKRPKRIGKAARPGPITPAAPPALQDQHDTIADSAPVQPPLGLPE